MLLAKHEAGLPEEFGSLSWQRPIRLKELEKHPKGERTGGKGLQVQLYHRREEEFGVQIHPFCERDDVTTAQGLKHVDFEVLWPKEAVKILFQDPRPLRHATRQL